MFNPIRWIDIFDLEDAAIGGTVEKGLTSLVALLRYFVDRKEFDIINKLKEVKTLDDLMGVITEALWVARKQRGEKGRDEEDRFVPIPTEEDVEEVLNAASKDLEAVKRKLVLFALARRSYEKD